ncbi:hypothetical protein BDV98DRAFT_583259 [Pterulicium gracile]|uniref:Uncharacterized protein n=1 Tax=Pterulicium gracile TaxID=1884261 RepID=A0A5C3QR39_9AGAR|nr:hypothetical protein BDV98DRAFT_583259 [Pterula gracilis]
MLFSALTTVAAVSALFPAVAASPTLATHDSTRPLCDVGANIKGWLTSIEGVNSPWGEANEWNIAGSQIVDRSTVDRELVISVNGSGTPEAATFDAADAHLPVVILANPFGALHSTQRFEINCQDCARKPWTLTNIPELLACTVKASSGQCVTSLGPTSDGSMGTRPCSLDNEVWFDQAFNFFTQA